MDAKREKALQVLKLKLDEIVSSGKRLSRVRMNYDMAKWLLEDLPSKYKKSGTTDWPLGACCALGGPYDAYIYVDNTLKDGSFSLDTEG